MAWVQGVVQHHFVVLVVGQGPMPTKVVEKDGVFFPFAQSLYCSGKESRLRGRNFRELPCQGGRHCVHVSVRKQITVFQSVSISSVKFEFWKPVGGGRTGRAICYFNRFYRDVRELVTQN